MQQMNTLDINDPQQRKILIEKTCFIIQEQLQKNAKIDRLDLNFLDGVIKPDNLSDCQLILTALLNNLSALPRRLFFAFILIKIIENEISKKESKEKDKEEELSVAQFIYNLDMEYEENIFEIIITTLLEKYNDQKEKLNTIFDILLKAPLLKDIFMPLLKFIFEKKLSQETFPIIYRKIAELDLREEDKLEEFTKIFSKVLNKLSYFKGKKQLSKEDEEQASKYDFLLDQLLEQLNLREENGKQNFKLVLNYAIKSKIDNVVRCLITQYLLKTFEITSETFDLISFTLFAIENLFLLSNRRSMNSDNIIETFISLLRFSQPDTNKDSALTEAKEEIYAVLSKRLDLNTKQGKVDFAALIFYTLKNKKNEDILEFLLTRFELEDEFANEIAAEIRRALYRFRKNHFGPNILLPIIKWLNTYEITDRDYHIPATAISLSEIISFSVVGSKIKSAQFNDPKLTCRLQVYKNTLRIADDLEQYEECLANLLMKLPQMLVKEDLTSENGTNGSLVKLAISRTIRRRSDTKYLVPIVKQLKVTLNNEEIDNKELFQTALNKMLMACTGKIEKLYDLVPTLLAAGADPLKVSIKNVSTAELKEIMKQAQKTQLFLDSVQKRISLLLSMSNNDAAKSMVTAWKVFLTFYDASYKETYFSVSSDDLISAFKENYSEEFNLILNTHVSLPWHMFFSGKHDAQILQDFAPDVPSSNLMLENFDKKDETTSSEEERLSKRAM